MQRTQNSHLQPFIVACLAVAALTGNQAATAACVEPNTCYGFSALQSNTFGNFNSAFGQLALYANTTGNNNSALGYYALALNTTGSENTAMGSQALNNNTTGNDNVANGVQALKVNTTGSYNTASGTFALRSNTAGSDNLATGFSALYNNTLGVANVATGNYALVTNTRGDYNTATGMQALYGNTTGQSNAANGYLSLANNTTGSYNTAVGSGTLQSSTTGTRNVALGFNAGYAITTGSDNIVIGAQTKGKAADSGVIRIGRSDMQTKAFIAGIRGASTGSANAVPVVIDSNGQLGTISSSRRFKEDIQPMGSVSERVYALRPVTFHYKQPYEDGSKPVQFGLVAEEVAQAFPELVVYGEDGRPETVRYDLLATLLVNEVQKQQDAMRDQTARIAALESQVAKLAEHVR